MKSIKFPNMLSKMSTFIVTDHEATSQNLKSLLLSEQGELVGDPYYGVKLKKYLYDQNNYVLKEILIDELYTQIATFMPQLHIQRSDIDITQDGSVLYASIKATNQLDFTTDMYNIVLLNGEDRI